MPERKALMILTLAIPIEFDEDFAWEQEDKALIALINPATSVEEWDLTDPESGQPIVWDGDAWIVDEEA